MRIDNPGNISPLYHSGDDEVEGTLLPEDILPSEMSEPKPHKEEPFQMAATLFALHQIIKRGGSNL